MSTTEDHIVSAARCGKVLKVHKDRNFSMLEPGEYPCTREKGHKPKTEHRAVVAWVEQKP